MATASVSSIKLHLAAAAMLGINVDDVLNHSGIDPGTLNNPENRLEMDAAIEMILRIAELAPVPSYGLWLGEHFHPAKLSLTGYVIMNARDLGDALAIFCRFQRVIGDAFSWEIDDSQENQVSMVLKKVSLGKASQLGQEWSPTALLVTAGILTGQPIRPLLVEFSHAKPEWHAEYDRIYHCPIRFGQPQTAMHFRREDFSLPVMHADPELAEQLQISLQRHLDKLQLAPSCSRRVSEILLRSMAGELPTVTQVARELAQSTRSLQASLQQEGTSFKQLLGSTRETLARDYLRDPGLSIAEISFLLGFSEPSAFHRAFRKWTGETPGYYREQHG